MTQMVTRCPTCATAFRVTSTQLESAKGAVRCGSCLNIFKAQDYLVKAADEEKALAQKPENVEAPKQEMVKPQAKVETPKQEQPKLKTPAPAPTTVKPKPVVVEQPVAKKVAAPVPKPAAEPIPATKVQATKPAPRPALVAEKPAVIAKPIIDKAKILADEDDILISDDMDRVEEKASSYEFDGFIDLDLHPKQTVSLFEREIRYEAARGDDEEETTDESWAEGLLDDDDEPQHQFKKKVVPTQPPAKAESPATDKLEASSSSKEPDHKYSGPVFSLVSESAAESVDDVKDETVFSDAFISATRAPEPAPQPSHFAALFAETESDEDSEESDKSSKRPVKSSSKMRAFDTSRAALLLNIMPAPVEFTSRRMRRWYQKKLWPSLAGGMFVLFFFQMAYFKFDYFSLVEPYRTAYLFICPLVGCEVPALVDTSKILATNLVVRNHPNTANALMVDAILINNAAFEQPFPDLILSFSKLDETPVASRRFTPKEYIGGELAGMKYIPQRQPVHITLEISDPGPEAVNYTLATH
ncbi:MAG: DUF3426 domain-containing protein [Cellvibrio sp.]